ncbi:hypothetical protein AGLY_013445 [Aphis glycines]|uniref:Uncharacterized protein n=1 Tax=Aphis glycines TaxID=307491 RepID=A0A6G0T6H8_APHGL|nr:hypothetical protein AGLY_013445 [Aphis glycines]
MFVLLRRNVTVIGSCKVFRKADVRNALASSVVFPRRNGTFGECLSVISPVNNEVDDLSATRQGKSTVIENSNELRISAAREVMAISSNGSMLLCVMRILRTVAFSTCCRSAELTSESPPQIFEGSSISSNKYTLKCTRRIIVKRRTIRNHMAFNDPLKPTYVNELIIEGEYREYGNERFLLYDNIPNANNRVLMLATDNYLLLLAKSDT